MGDESEKIELIERSKCDSCGSDLEVGDWPFCPHGRPSPGTISTSFAAYFDHGLGEYITSNGQRRQLMRGDPARIRRGVRKGQLEYRAKKMGMPGCEF